MFTILNLVQDKTLLPKQEEPRFFISELITNKSDIYHSPSLLATRDIITRALEDKDLLQLFSELKSESGISLYERLVAGIYYNAQLPYILREEFQDIEDSSETDIENAASEADRIIRSAVGNYISTNDMIFPNSAIGRMVRNDICKHIYNELKLPENTVAGITYLLVLYSFGYILRETKIRPKEIVFLAQVSSRHDARYDIEVMDIIDVIKEAVYPLMIHQIYYSRKLGRPALLPKVEPGFEYVAKI